MYILLQSLGFLHTLPILFVPATSRHTLTTTVIRQKGTIALPWHFVSRSINKKHLRNSGDVGTNAYRSWK